MTKTFSSDLIRWYHQSGRFDLPWQKNKTAYRIWISEIMLQQTQVMTVIPYYEKFMTSFPSTKQLALADQDYVLSHWSGLGYYARARNLHKTAQIIHQEHKGRFPKTVEGLEALPGIGKSTAGAILSFAFELPTTICDGNVKRVLSRYFAIDLPKQSSKMTAMCWDLAEQLTPKTNTHFYNQAIMDLGATICTRTKPQCTSCPFHQSCKAYALGEPTKFPVSVKKAKRPTRKTYMLLLQNEQGQVLLEKRPPVGIWGGLWCFPQCDLDTDVNEWCLEKLGANIKQIEELDVMHHQFTHFKLEISPLLITFKTKKLKLMDTEQVFWYTLDSKLPGGICTPVSKLINFLTVEKI